MTVLNTERLVLRPFTLDDGPTILATLQEFDVSSWIPLMPHPYGGPDAQAFLEIQMGTGQNALAVTCGGDLIGCITTVTELGYWFAKPTWGKGFCTEAARAMVDHHFGMGRGTMTSGYQIGNERSCRVLTKLGFVPTETVQRHSLAYRKNVTIQRMELPRATWEARP